MNRVSFPAVVIGSGLAGLSAALEFAPVETLLITKTPTLSGGSTPWAQGGIAIPRDAEDIPFHKQDTRVSGAFFGDGPAIDQLIDQAPVARDWLESQGIAFDHDANGNYVYGREGAHSARRILHVGADGTGAGLANGLIRTVESRSHITVWTETLAVQVVSGAVLVHHPRQGLVLVESPRIILAGGGLGQLFPATTAPIEATGDTIALAALAGARCVDLEMVQYHPTALAKRPVGSAALSLLTEALRGEGAQLVTATDASGTNLSPLDTGHPLGSLGPRDVLSRAIYYRQTAGFPVWLDARMIPDVRNHFPTVTRLCADVGLDVERDLLPVVPAVHYTMGGVAVDLKGRTSLPGIWAAGETARSGVHGGNRLASNSLLECVVWGRCAAASARETTMGPQLSPVKANALQVGWENLRFPRLDRVSSFVPKIQDLMGRCAGPVRDGATMSEGLETLVVLQSVWDKATSGGPRLSELDGPSLRQMLEIRSRLVLAPMVLTQALERRVSLGAHYRSDSEDVRG